jgi:hypothetical protein
MKRIRIIASTTSAVLCGLSLRDRGRLAGEHADQGTRARRGDLWKGRGQREKGRGQREAGSYGNQASDPSAQGGYRVVWTL